MRTTNTQDNTRELVEAIVKREWFAEKGTANMTDKILAEFVVIPRADLPAVEEGRSTFLVADRNYGKGTALSSRRTAALDRIAILEYCDAKDEKRNARRKELAIELAAGGVADIKTYTELSDISLKAIDRIIELEEAAA